MTPLLRRGKKARGDEGGGGGGGGERHVVVMHASIFELKGHAGGILQTRKKKKKNRVIY